MRRSGCRSGSRSRSTGTSITSRLGEGLMTTLGDLKSKLMESSAFRAEYEKACVEYQALEAELAASASNQSRKIVAGPDNSAPDSSQ